MLSFKQISTLQPCVYSHVYTPLPWMTKGVSIQIPHFQLLYEIFTSNALTNYNTKI